MASGPVERPPEARHWTLRGFRAGTRLSVIVAGGPALKEEEHVEVVEAADVDRLATQRLLDTVSEMASRPSAEGSSESPEAAYQRGSRDQLRKDVEALGLEVLNNRDWAWTHNGREHRPWSEAIDHLERTFGAEPREEA